jgi:hypothetical protein
VVIAASAAGDVNLLAADALVEPDVNDELPDLLDVAYSNDEGDAEVEVEEYGENLFAGLDTT